MTEVFKGSTITRRRPYRVAATLRYKSGELLGLRTFEARLTSLRYTREKAQKAIPILQNSSRLASIPYLYKYQHFSSQF